MNGSLWGFPRAFNASILYRFCTDSVVHVMDQSWAKIDVLFYDIPDSMRIFRAREHVRMIPVNWVNEHLLFINYNFGSTEFD